MRVDLCLLFINEATVGGFILAPDTLIPVPEANYRAYLFAAERFGRYPLEAST